MEQICQQCGSVKKQIPAGVSKKTGKPYKAFSACPKNCGRYQATSPSGNSVPMAKSSDLEQRVSDLEKRIATLEGQKDSQWD